MLIYISLANIKCINDFFHQNTGNIITKGTFKKKSIKKKIRDIKYKEKVKIISISLVIVLSF